MNKRGYGRDRDRRIVQHLETFHYSTLDILAETYFRTVSVPYRRMKAGERLRRLIQQKRVTVLCLPEGTKIYAQAGEKGVTKAGHWIMIQEVLRAIKGELASWETMTYEVEVSQGPVVCDLILTVRNPTKREPKIVFVECENESTGKIREKVVKYYEVLEEGPGELRIYYRHRRVGTELESINIPLEYRGRISWRHWEGGL